MKLIDELTQGLEVMGIDGYSESEISKMESFYNIKISGDLRRFFSELGRSSGSVQFSVFLIPYIGYYAVKRPVDVSGHVVTQLDFKSDLLKHGRAFVTGLSSDNNCNT